MRIGYFDCATGASGDMILGALVDAGYPVEDLRGALERLGVDGFRVEARPVERGGIRGTQLVVDVEPGRHFATLGDMLAPVEKSGLPGAVRRRAAAILGRLAEAEARVHRVPVEAVHFHEVGALDTLVDAVGAAAALDGLGIERVHVSPLPLGGGTVETAHGRLPVPAPATLELLHGFALCDTGIRAELVTPTGAAILAEVATPAPLPPMTLERVGWGAGARELPVPNLLRLLVGEGAGVGDAGETETLLTVETTIDDMSPQLYEPLMESLFEAGALDVYLTPVVMKKSRPGVVLTALAPPRRAGALAELLFRESTTLGVRLGEVRRVRLPREVVELDTRWGRVPFKVSRLRGRATTVTPEFDVVRRIARAEGQPVREVLDAVREEGRRIFGNWGEPQ
jgi:pyridinium-3,5-bisthiocarboxylic acid mononucleotide nickel chelatase